MSGHPRRGVLTGLVAAGLVALAGGAQAQSGGAPSGPAIPITIAWQPSTTIADYYLARKQGIFEEVGLKPNHLKFLSGPAIFAALKSGDVDIAEMGTTPAIVGRGQGIPFRIVALSGDGTATVDLVARPGVKGMEDLRGKKVASATGSAWHYALAKSLERAGMTFKDIQYVNLAPKDMAAAFRNGDIDAVWVASPFVEQIVRVGGVRIVDAPRLGIRTPSLWVARADWVAQHPEGLQRWFRAMESGLELARKDMDRTADIAAEYIGLPKAEVAPMLQRTEFHPLRQQVAPEFPFSLTRGFPGGDAGYAQVLKDYMVFLVSIGSIQAPYPIADLLDPEPARKYAGR